MKILKTKSFMKTATFIRKQKLSRVDRGYLSHCLLEDFCILRVLFLGRLWYAKISSDLLATIEQYRISFKRNIMVVNEQFIRRRHLWQPAPVTG